MSQWAFWGLATISTELADLSQTPSCLLGVGGGERHPGPLLQPGRGWGTEAALLHTPLSLLTGPAGLSAHPSHGGRRNT